MSKRDMIQKIEQDGNTFTLTMKDDSKLFIRPREGVDANVQFISGDLGNMENRKLNKVQIEVDHVPNVVMIGGEPVIGGRERVSINEPKSKFTILILYAVAANPVTATSAPTMIEVVDG